MAPTYLVSEFDIDAALHHLARLEGDSDWRRETLKDVIASKIIYQGGIGEFFHVAGGVFAILIRAGRIEENRIQVILLMRPIESMNDDPKKMTVLSVGL